MKQKAQFFELDLFIAVAVLIASLLIIKSLFIHTNAHPQTEDFAQDASNILSTQKLFTLDKLYLQMLNASASPATQLDLNKTIAYNIALLIINNQDNLAESLAKETLKSFPSHINYNISFISQDQKHPIVTSPVPPKDSIARSQSLLSGLEIGKPTSGFTAGLFLTSANTTESEYAYFGGFIGQGNITTKIVLPQNFTAIDLYIEGDFHDEFALYINQNYCDTITIPPNPDPFIAITTHTLPSSCLNHLASNTNTFNINFTNDIIENKFVGGGFIKVSYFSDQLSTQTNTYNLPAIDGVFNIFDSFYIPGTPTSMMLNLHYNVKENPANSTLFVAIANKTVYKDNSLSNETYVSMDLAPFLDFNELTNKTTPLRIGFENITALVVNTLLSDAVLVTDVSGSMAFRMDADEVVGEKRECDDPLLYDNSSRRLSIAKCAAKNFSKIVLNTLGNKVGLIGYASSEKYLLDLTDDLGAIYDEIGDSSSGYEATGATCIACGIHEARELLEETPQDKLRFMVVMSDGIATKCKDDPAYPSCSNAIAAQQAIDYAQLAHDVYNISIFSIAFGPSAGIATMQQIAAVDNISNFYHATDATDVDAIYELIAQEIVSAGSYSAQIISTNEIQSTLFEDSSITYTYAPNTDLTPPNSFILSGEIYPFSSSSICTVTQNDFPQVITPLDAFMVSYSSSHWTTQLSINTQTIFNLSSYNKNYEFLGDPTFIGIPQGVLSHTNTYTLLTADNQTSATGCSPFSKLIYKAAIPSSLAVDNVYPTADGCSWEIQFPTKKSIINVPYQYNGSNTCYYTEDEITYNAQDAYDVLIFEFLHRFDMYPQDGILDIDFTQESINVSLQPKTNIPYLWGPALLEVVTWH